MRKLDLTGCVFGRLTIIRFACVEKGSTYFKCRCSCGNVKIIKGVYLTKGDTVSCGCLRKENTARMGKSRKTHGMHNTRFYRIWRGILGRCLNKDDDAFHDYGGRGITVCDEWKDFENFRRDMCESYDESLQIERIDNNDGYYKENCCWATRKEQGRNRRTSLPITWQGQTKTLAEWCELLDINYITAHSRLRRGKGVAYALDQKKHSLFKENNPRSKYIAFRGERKTITEWAKQMGLGAGTLGYRLRQGWSVKKALLTPLLQ
jgi:hypothetical protein